MKRKGSTWIVLLVLIALIAIGVIWYFLPSIEQTLDPNIYKLQSSEVSGLVSYLAENNLQAAVVQKVYNNGVSNWIVKSNGDMIFLDKRNLGCITQGIGPCIPDWEHLSNFQGAVGIYILQDQAEISEDNAYGEGCDNACDFPNQGTIKDISAYVTNHLVDPFWHANSSIASTLGVYSPWGGGNIVSPDGNYIVMEEQSTTIGYPDVGNITTYQQYPILILAKIIRNGNSITYQPITYLPAEGAEWSTNSRYVLLDNEIYDVQQNNGSYVKIASYGDDGYEHPIGDTIAFKNSVGDIVATGTFVYANFEKSNQTIDFRKGDGSEINILTQSGLFEPSTNVSSSLFLGRSIPVPQEIRLAGYIQ